MLGFYLYFRRLDFVHYRFLCKMGYLKTVSRYGQSTAGCQFYFIEIYQNRRFFVCVSKYYKLLITLMGYTLEEKKTYWDKYLVFKMG